MTAIRTAQTAQTKMRPSAVSLSKFGLLPASFAATASLNHNEHFSVY